MLNGRFCQNPSVSFGSDLAKKAELRVTPSSPPQGFAQYRKQIL
jgi:hypothetical protein